MMTFNLHVAKRCYGRSDGILASPQQPLTCERGRGRRPFRNIKEHSSIVIVHGVHLRLYPSRTVLIFTCWPTSQSCEEYCAAASIDLDHDRAGLAANRNIANPALRINILWGEKMRFGDL